MFRVLATVHRRRFKRFVATEEEAKALARQWSGLRQQPGGIERRDTRLSPEELVEAEAATQIVKARGLKLVDVVLRGLAQIQITPAGASTAATAATRPAPIGCPAPTIPEAFEEFLATKRERSLSHQKSLRATQKGFVRMHGKKELAAIEHEDVAAWLSRASAGRGPTTFNRHRENINSFFAYAVARKWRHDSPTSAIEAKPKTSEIPKIMPPAAIATLFADLEENYPLWVPYFALTFFAAVRAGMREGECERLDAALRAGKQVLYPGGVSIKSKTGRARYAPWSPPLRAWLAAYPLSKELLPGGVWRAEEVIRKIRLKHELSRNVGRHCGITGMAIITNSIVDTARACDTSEPIIKRHYLGLWTKEDAEAFYRILPRRKASDSADDLKSA